MGKEYESGGLDEWRALYTRPLQVFAAALAPRAGKPAHTFYNPEGIPVGAPPAKDVAPTTEEKDTPPASEGDGS